LMMRNPDETAAQGPIMPYKKIRAYICIRSGTLLKPHWARPSPGDSLQFDRRACPLAAIYLYLVGPLFYFAISNLVPFTPVNYGNCVHLLSLRLRGAYVDLTGFYFFYLLLLQIPTLFLT
jgi:hypothetical protein